jgi:hypothetical protein
MKVQTSYGYRTLADLATGIGKLATAVSAGWNVEHLPDGTHGAVTVTGLALNDTTQTTVGAAGGASALPATPTGYVPVTIDGTEYVLPYYAKT